MPKLAVREAELTVLGLASDEQAHTRFHGGPQRALCLYALELVLKLQAEGHPIYPGSTGENITTVNLDWEQLQPGCRLVLGDAAAIEISSYTVPCKNIAASFLDGNFKRIAQNNHPGEARLYARVLRTGRLRVGQPIQIIDSANPKILA